MSPARISHNLDNERIGPHPSYIELAKPYIFQSKIHECLTVAAIPEANDDNIRLQGVTWIDNVRKFMHLPVRTYNTAAVHYHKFRLVHPEANGYIDAAAAALFTACKLEDTLKKSKEILCAAYNMKLSPAEHLTPDDPMFEQHSKTIIGLERLMLEASGFDFRNRYPQRILLKLAKHYKLDQDTVGKTAYNMSLDLYRTYAPLRQTAAAMAVSCVELAGRLWDQSVGELEVQSAYKQFWITRAEVMETLLDLLDLYTHHRTSTVVGPSYAIERFIGIRITLNQEASAKKLPRHTGNDIKPLANGTMVMNGTSKKNLKKDGKKQGAAGDLNSAEDKSAAINGSSAHKPGLKDGTVRFMLDPQRAKEEQYTVSEFFNVEEEEYESEFPIEQSTERERRRV